MVNRIMEILKFKNLTASKFADEIGVQRSSISHILSERNKPSLELIQKILNTYTDISSEWLLTGKNSMISDEPDLFTHSQLINTDNEEIRKEDELENEITNVNNVISQKTNELNPGKDTFVNNQKEETEMNKVSNQLIDSKALTNKTVDRIVIFYSDKTFKEYLPE